MFKIQAPLKKKKKLNFKSYAGDNPIELYVLVVFESSPKTNVYGRRRHSWYDIKRIDSKCIGYLLWL